MNIPLVVTLVLIVVGLIGVIAWIIARKRKRPATSAPRHQTQRPDLSKVDSPDQDWSVPPRASGRYGSSPHRDPWAGASAPRQTPPVTPQPGSDWTPTIVASTFGGENSDGERPDHHVESPPAHHMPTTHTSHTSTTHTGDYGGGHHGGSDGGASGSDGGGGGGGD